GWRELAKRGLAPGWSHFLASKTAGHRGIWKFALSNNARISLAVVAKEADDLIVAAFLGATGVALWKIVKQVSSVLGVPAKLFVYSVFPQLARMWSAGDYRGFRSLVLRGGAVSTVGAVGVVVVYALWGPALLDLFFFRATQKDFVAAFEPGLLFLCSRVITMFASPFMPALTAMGRAYRNLKLAFIMTCVTVPVLILATWQFGLVGAAWSRIFTEALSCAVFGAVVMRAVDSRIRRAAAAPPA
ncbi:MAG: polysaccharide biosynthesis C-terminal domain-containing protein, partial [Rhodospirillales bacterium]|nr:polysaccharide biosynthesis C-terminal domain-containing protein [Rhodospirillales bacterium]